MWRHHLQLTLINFVFNRHCQLIIFLLFPIITFFGMMLLIIIIITSLFNSVSPSLLLVSFYSWNILRFLLARWFLFFTLLPPPSARRRGSTRAYKVAGVTLLVCVLIAGQAMVAFFLLSQKGEIRALEEQSDSLRSQMTRGRMSGGGITRGDAPWTWNGKKKIMIIIICTKSFRLILFTSCLQPLTCPSAPSLKWLTSLWTR